MKLTVAFVTGRADPKLEWVVDELYEQAKPSDVIDILVVDALCRSPFALVPNARPAGCLRQGSGVKSVRVVDPKPNIWQGKHRITKCDWWGASSSRNTAFVYSEHDYIAFLDDRSHIGPKWLETVRRGERERASVIAGTYDKLENGVLTSDTRRPHAPNGKINCGGGWLYGCTFALPLEWALNVGGFEEGCDGQGAEDYIFGLNLANAGYRIDFSVDLAVRQERAEVSKEGVGGAGSSGYKRIDKGISPNDKSHAALARFGSRAHTEFTPDLRHLRELAQRGEPMPIPDPNYDYRDWFDGQLIRTM